MVYIFTIIPLTNEFSLRRRCCKNCFEVVAGQICCKTCLNIKKSGQDKNVVKIVSNQILASPLIDENKCVITSCNYTLKRQGNGQFGRHIDGLAKCL